MDFYHIWFDLKDSRRDLDFADALERYLNHLRGEGMIEGWRLTRRKLGFSPPHFAEFHVAIEVKNLDQLEQAFQHAATRSRDVERLHAGVYSHVRKAQFALYRDFPDPGRERKPRSRSLGFTTRAAGAVADDDLPIEPLVTENEPETSED